MTCGSPVELEKLVAYWLGELPAALEEPLEEHLFGCAHCARRLEQLAALAHGVRAAVEGGRISLAISRDFVQAMKQAGLRLREYRVEPGGSVNCTIRADDDAVVSRLRAPLAGVRRVDLVRMPDGGPEMRLVDVPFDPQAGEVLVILAPQRLKAMPAFRMQMKLVAVDEKGEAPIGEYTFNHSPS